MSRETITKCGCFMIFNKVNRKVYICTSTNTRRFYSQIRYMIKNNKFNNTQLVEDWKEYGPNQFEYQFLEECHPSDFYQVKKKWVEYYEADNPEKGYNSAENTYNV